MNPLTTPFFWTLSGTLGAAIFGVNVKTVMMNVQNGERLRTLTKGAGIYLAGNTIIALVTAVLSYFLALRAVTLYRKKRRKRKLRRREKKD